MLSADQRDVLQEIANIGMGQAGASIAKVLDHYISLSIPKVQVLASGSIPELLAGLVGEGRVSAVRQAFHSQARGEAIVIFGEQRCNDLADLLGYEQPLDHASEVELLLDVSNLLVGGCLSGIAEQLKADIGFSAPSLLAEHVTVRTLVRSRRVAWEQAIAVEINFSLKQRSFSCHLVIFIPDEELGAFTRALDHYLEGHG
jgi:chemotaxis protein CheC